MLIVEDGLQISFGVMGDEEHDTDGCPFCLNDSGNHDPFFEVVMRRPGRMPSRRGLDPGRTATPRNPRRCRCLSAQQSRDMLCPRCCGRSVVERAQIGQKLGPGPGVRQPATLVNSDDVLLVLRCRQPSQERLQNRLPLALGQRVEAGP